MTGNKHRRKAHPKPLKANQCPRCGGALELAAGLRRCARCGHSPQTSLHEAPKRHSNGRDAIEPDENQFTSGDPSTRGWLTREIK